uniref:Cytochrome c biogenesis protein CcsA n=1 Tax=Stigeoclonium helveticum TaxID=55999 RepID=Q06SG2_STIHE|nr:cytochrome c biogenesis protein [Stigeoclonium helveticum]ABF60152.1 heme attachment to plastid cytochrome c [Stigeoclonium helveticum]
MIFNFENFMANLSFCLLFLTMLLYWIAIGLPETSKMILISRISMILANLSLFLLLALRWKDSGHFPLSNLYESLIFLSWSLTSIQIFLDNKNKMTKFTTTASATNFSFIGAIIAPSALLTDAFATFSLPQEMQKTSALVPALQSNWLVMHVTIMILSYAALICGCLLSIAFLIITRGEEINLIGNRLENDKSVTSLDFGMQSEDKQKDINNNIIFSSSSPINSFLMTDYSDSKSSAFDLNPTKVAFPSLSLFSLSIAKNLDNLSYRVLGMGFPLLTIGILSGSVWANEAWGSYWSWDPKETWALLTWLVFAIYLHTRLTKGWQGKKPAIIAAFGFIVVWICFIGVNLLGKGLHSYGWLS